MTKAKVKRVIGRKKAKRAEKKAAAKAAVSKVRGARGSYSRKEQKALNRGTKELQSNIRIHAQLAAMGMPVPLSDFQKKESKKTMQRRLGSINLRSLARQKGLSKGIQKEIAKFL
jgi:hypothetical protein